MTSVDAASAKRVLDALKVDTDCPFYQRLFAFIDVESTTALVPPEDDTHGASGRNSKFSRFWDMWNRISPNAFYDSDPALVAGLLTQLLDTLTWAHYSVLSKSVNFVSLGMHLVLHVPNTEFRTYAELDARCRVVADPVGNVKTLEGCLFGARHRSTGERIRLATLTQNVAVFPPHRTSDGMIRLISKM